LTGVLLERGFIASDDDVFQLTREGRAWFNRLDISLPEKRPPQRRFARACLDWTEKRPHLAGVLGEELLRDFISRGWLERWPADRTLTVTADGETALEAELAISLR
jgi:hypothetical protein